MKVYINRSPRNGPWGGGAMFTKAFHKLVDREGVELLVDQTMNINPDVILVAGLENENLDISIEQAIMYKLYMKPDCRIVLRVNENDARKATTGVDDMWRRYAYHVDGTVFVSRWLQDYFVKLGWGCQSQAVIHNGVDREVFKTQPKLNNGKLNIVAHHWSDNWMKGFDIYEAIDEFVGENPDKFAFTYIGRHRSSFKHTNVVKPLYGKELGAELGKHDVYVSASRFDPGPNHVLEALSCDLPTYVHKDGGGAVEFAGLPATYSSWEDLKSRLITGLHPTGIPAITVPTWETCIAEYVTYLDSVRQA